MRRRRGVEARTIDRTAWRLGLQAGAGALVIVLLLLATVVATLVQVTAAEQDQRLTVTAQQADDVNDSPDAMWIALRTASGTAVSGGMPGGLPVVAALDRVAAGGTAESATVTVDGHEYRIRTAARPGHSASVVQVVLDTGPDRNRVAEVLRALGIAALAGLVLVVAGGVWFARRAVAPLEAAMLLQQRFVADAGHELRTPVTLLSTRAQLLRRALRRASGDPDPGQDTSRLAVEADSLVADADHLAVILDDLLLAADPGAGAPHDEVDLPAVAAAVVDSARPAARAAEVALDLDAPATASVRGVETALRRAVTAVVDNAIRHAATRVVISVAPGRSQVVIEITDDGPGIDADVLPHLFRRFATGDTSSVGRRRRYGIGLALVSDVIAQHGGSVSADNAPSGGARFRLAVPTGPTRLPRR